LTPKTPPRIPYKALKEVFWYNYPFNNYRSLFRWL